MSSERRFRAFPGPGQPPASIDLAGMILAAGVAIVEVWGLNGLEPDGRPELVALVQEWDGELHVSGRGWYKLTAVTLGQWAVPHLLDAIDRALARELQC